MWGKRRAPGSFVQCHFRLEGGKSERLPGRSLAPPICNEEALWSKATADTQQIGNFNVKTFVAVSHRDFEVIIAAKLNDS